MIISDLHPHLASLLEKIEVPLHSEQIQPAIELLAARIEDVPDLWMFNNEQRLISRGSHGLCSDGLARDLIQRALETSPSKAIDDLQRYVTSPTMRLRKMVFLGGIQFDAVVDFGGGITFAPYSAETRPLRLYYPGLDAIFKDSVRIDALLWEDLDFPIAYGSTDIHLPDYWDFSALDDARYCLSLAGPSGPVQLGTSIAAVDWIPCFLPLGEIPHREESRSCPSLPAEQIEYAADAHRSFIAQPSKLQNRLRVSLERLNWAKRRRWEVDQAIDLGIACETAFGAERPFEASINFTLRVRAAHFLGTTYSERHRIYTLLSDLYDLRSKAVHTGIIPDNRRGRSPREIIDDGCSLLRDALYQLIKHGEPDWTAVVLGKFGDLSSADAA